jgi:hypothetical protein
VAMLGSDDSGPIRMDLGHAACAATKLCKNAALWLCSRPRAVLGEFHQKPGEITWGSAREKMGIPRRCWWFL